MNLVTVIIVNYNGGHYLQRCLDCLSRQSFADFKALIVDNASTDSSLEIVGNLDRRFSIIELKRNIGFAAANNIAIARADTDWIATLNPDAFPKTDWLEKMIDGTFSYPDVMMFGSVQIQDKRPNFLDGLGDVYSGLGIFWRGAYGNPVDEMNFDAEIFSPCAAAALYKRKVLLDVGGFDESFFCYCEDIDLGFRLRLLGHKCILLKDSVVRHLGSETVGRYGDFAIYHGFRNRLWAFVKNYPHPLFFVLTPISLGIMFLLALEKIKIGKAYPAISGLLDAFKDIRRVFRQRKQIQSNRIADSKTVYKSMCWSFSKLISRSPDLRPLK